jgi:hypothetical protein
LRDKNERRKKIIKIINKNNHSSWALIIIRFSHIP